jgi:anti-sigma28 factor (negative regulator of flagellin synthesis)
MNFQSLNNNSAYSLINNKSNPTERSTRQPDTDNLDKKNHLGTKDRTKLLKSIKSKIKSGYYDSNEVIDEISDAFAKVFDKTL